MELHQARHHREVRRVDDGAAGVIGVGVRHDARDPITFDDHVDVRARGRTFHVHELPGVHDDVRRRNGGCVLQIERNGARLAGLDVDDAQRVE